MERDYDFETEPDKRPSFLTWLCILTFIGSGWGIISGILSYTAAHKASTMFSENLHVRDSVVRNDTAKVAIRKNRFFSSGKVKRSFSKMFQEDNIRKTALGKLIAAILTLTGALLMWQLKRTGFYLYIAGIIVAIALPFYLFGNDLVAVGASSFANFFGLIFIALYALNLKSLK